MFRVCAISVLTLGLLLLAASSQAQQPGPMMNGPMPLPQPGFGPQGMPGMPGMVPQGPPMGFDPAFAQAMYNAPMDGPYGVAPAQYQGDMPQPIIAGEGYGGYGDCGCGGPCDGGCGQPCGMPCDMPCCEPCPPDCCPAVCSFEVESTFLYPDIKGTEAVGQLDAPAVPLGAIFFSEDAGLEDEVTASPRIWLHCQKCEWGVGLRYWNLDDSEVAFTPLNLLQLNIIGDYRLERLEAEVADIELTYSWNHGQHHYGLMSGTSFRLSVGGRHAEYENDSLILANGSFTDAIAHASAIAQNRFDGEGITSGARGTICLKHNVSLFWGVRGSLLWGDMTTLAQTAATAIYEVDPAAGEINSAGSATDEELFIGETQLGIQCEHQLRCIPAVAFIRVAAEYQLWEINSDAFSFAESAVQVDVIPPGESIIAASQAFSQAPKLDLYGITLSTGITW